ncbi:MAG: DUF58 domain-containing protein, partial [Actinobacteria bacterium]|nr:DUF58 domain-containing protein [Actinomycetota bacterium]
ITVLPKIDSLIASTLEIDADTRASVPTPAISGSEFASLREYVDGDDLRKVHWRATSRREELIVRRDERPRRSGCTVVLDTRATVQDPVTFERSVSAAAGILTAAIEAGQSARLCSTTGFDSGEGSGSRHLDAMLGVLAMIDTDRGAAFAPVRAHEPSILVTTAAGAGSPRGESSIGVVAPFIVAFDPLEPEPARPTGAGRGPVPVLHIGAVDDFATVWNSEIGRRRTTTTRRHAGVR